MGVAVVQGFQGDATFADKKHVVATLKHFAAHGQPESGTNCAPVNVSERILREVFLFPFQAAIHEGGAMSVMASYNEIDGVPSHANRWLLRDVFCAGSGVLQAPLCPTTTPFVNCTYGPNCTAIIWPQMAGRQRHSPYAPA